MFFQVDQLVFEELVRERFPKLGLYFVGICHLCSFPSFPFVRSFLGSFLMSPLHLLQSII